MPGTPVILDSMGGLVTTSRPENIPEGASPRTWDTDFIVGRFIQRAGLQNVYSYGAGTFGPNGGSLASDVNTQNHPWGNPSNILANDGTFTVSTPTVTTYNVTGTAGSSGTSRGSYIVVYFSETVAPVGSSYTFSGLTSQTTLNGLTLTSVSIYGIIFPSNAAAFLLYAGNYLLTADTGTATSTNGSTFTTDVLQISGFNFTIPSSSTILGISVSVKGYSVGSLIYAQLTKLGNPVGDVISGYLPTSNTFVTVGGSSNLWGSNWGYGDIDSNGFGVTLFANSSSPQTIALDYCEITVYTSTSQVNFLGLVSANLDSSDLTTLALDANGLSWEEDVTNDPGVLDRASLIPAVIPGSYMKGVDANGIAYMAYSDLTQGTSQPVQYAGAWCDRITQVGPGAPPVFTPQQATADSFSISTITQPAQEIWQFSYFLQSSGAGSTAAGTNVTIYYADSTTGTLGDVELQNEFNNGNAVYLYLEFTGSGIPTQGPYVVQVTSVGLGNPPGQPRAFYYFTYTLPTSAYAYYQGSGHSTYTVTYQQSLATLTTSVQVPGLTVGNQITIAGSTPGAWNSTWVLTQDLNSGSVNITQTSVSSGTATFNYILITGVAPYAGQTVTITNTLNANGALNGANLTIATASGGSSGSFTINVSLANFSAVAETGQGVTSGTIFAFDPGAIDNGTSTNPIFGNATGGALTFSAATATFITPGVKQGTVFGITRNGAVTMPANPVTFTIPANTTGIVATQIPVGPPNWVARGIAFTESGQNEVPGANFYTYDTPVTFYVNGTEYTATALIIPDNVTTSATFSFPDSVLLASDEIDIQGNNYFNLREIGSPAWIFQYANRMLYGLCQAKIDNFNNLTFDGGYIPVPNPQPLGWTTVAAPTGITAGLVTSPDFGNSLQILNAGTSTVTSAYLYYQSAYQDFYLVDILQANTAYSVRFKARSLNADGQQVTIVLAPYTGSFGTPLGSATFTLEQGDFTIQTAQILVSQIAIPSTLQIAIQIASITAGSGVQIDRIEIFETNHPVDNTTIWTSYAGNFEAVDRVTGQLGCGDDNAQPTQGAYQILEQLYINKTASKCVTQDSPNYEPNQWNVPLSSQGVGAIGPNAFYAEEEFSIEANRSGLFLFDGGKPMPISRELQSTGVNASLWEKINWAAAETVWVRFSTDKRQLYVGVPMITPNFWLPNAPSATPTSPNIVIMCNFTGCPTAEELADSSPVHTTMFGDLKALDMRRKWSLWNMAIPIAEFTARQDGVSQPLFLCNGIASSKIYQLIDGAASGGQNTDDGTAINWLYTTYAFTGAKQGQQNPSIGALRKIWYYFSSTMEGVGQVARKFYSNTLGALAQNTYTAPLATLSYPAQNDQEAVLEIGGQRLFVELSAVGSGGYAEVGPIILDGEMDKNSPHRGVSA